MAEINERRKNSRKVSGWWMSMKMRELVQGAYPDLFEPTVVHHLSPSASPIEQVRQTQPPTFGQNWLYRFIRRFDLSWRKTTKNKEKPTIDRLPRIQRFHQGLRLLLLDADARRGSRQLDPKWGRFPPQYRFNWDEIPWAFIGGLSHTWTKKVGHIVCFECGDC